MAACILWAATVSCAPGPDGLSKTFETETSSELPAISELESRIEHCLEAGLSGRRLDASVNAAWQIMHGVACYGQRLKVQTPDAGLVGAVEYAFNGGMIRGFELMTSGENLPATGREGLKARLEPGSYEGQGHVDQWIAIFAMADLPLNTAISVGEKQFILEDLVRQAQNDVTRNILDEYGWTLIALTHYFPDEPQWQTIDGVTVSWEDLVAVELDSGVSGAACGGTHKLAGIVRALAQKRRLQLPDNDVWREAEDFVAECIDSVKNNRGPDGRLSAFYFDRPGATSDVSAELSSTGHLLEFVALALSPEQLAEQWVELAALRLCELLDAAEAAELDCGGLYHGLNGLKIYQQRRFKPQQSPAS